MTQAVDRARRGARARWARSAGVVAGLMWVALSIGCDEREPAARNVLLIVIDTLRADHLSAYGYPRATSPHIDALAAAGTLFERHIASASQTVPSTLSLLLSRHPAEHGFLHERPGHFARNPPRYPGRLLFLSEIFRAAGYRTGGFVGNPFLRRRNGFAQGFERFAYLEGAGEQLTEAAIEWLARPDPESRPFYAYLHYFDVHSPYEPPPAYRERFERPGDGRNVFRNGPMPGLRAEDLAQTIAMYDAEIAYVDDQIGVLLAALDALDQRADTLIAVTSDHGEEFLEHGGLGHGTSVYGEQVRVPLVLVGPGFDARRVDTLSRHLDVAPTLLEWAKIPVPPAYRGHALGGPTTPAFADNGPWLGVYAGERKLVIDRETGEHRTFSASDPLDQQPIDDPTATPALLEQVRWYGELERAGPDAAPGHWSKRDLERLKALGYAQ